MAGAGHTWPRWGLSLLEVIIGVAVLSCGLLPVFYLFSRGNMGTMMTRDEILAHAWAAELVDFAQAQGFDRLDPAANQRREVPVVAGGTPVDPRFRRFLTVTGQVLPPGNADWPIDYRIILAEVTWTTGGVAQQFALTGLVFAGRRP
ncbi:MAG: hypothetical protein GX442_06540 [Candidatus Riflebacteria bacterium]|nr:hypothetical protein [Candidatus Riflebacteria bacterium]